LNPHKPPSRRVDRRSAHRICSPRPLHGRASMFRSRNGWCGIITLPGLPGPIVGWFLPRTPDVPKPVAITFVWRRAFLSKRQCSPTRMLCQPHVSHSLCTRSIGMGDYASPTALRVPYSRLCQSSYSVQRCSIGTDPQARDCPRQMGGLSRSRPPWHQEGRIRMRMGLANKMRLSRKSKKEACVEPIVFGIIRVLFSGR
jgi:hypothetical protein